MEHMGHAGHAGHKHHAEVAIATTNHLMGLGLKSILEKVIPMAEIEIFSSFEELDEADSSRFSHFFVSYRIFCSNKDFFIAHGRRTIILVDSAIQSQDHGLLTININQSEELIVRDIFKMRNHSHRESHSIKNYHAESSSNSLSDREKEVLSFVAQGFINKEIAEKMNISITTVISHRKNITSKLGIKSVAGLTVYAISNGYVDLESIM